MSLPQNLYGWNDKTYKPDDMEPLSLIVEYAKSNRSQCVKCKKFINKDEVRFGEQCYNECYLNTRFLH